MPTSWSTDELNQLTSPTEVRVITQRVDGTYRPGRIIWIVQADDRAFIRSTNGRTADWYRHAIGTGKGRIDADGRVFAVTFAAVTGDDLTIVDDAYRRKYRSYSSIVDHLQEAGPREATLELILARG